MATTYTDPAGGFAAFALQARTDTAGGAVTDLSGEDLRLVSSLFSAGVIQGDSFKVQERGAGANMSVDVGSGSAEADLAVVAGTVAGQGNYLARLGDSVTNVTVPAADLSNPRVDEVYLVVQDNAYDSSTRVVVRLAYRDGTPAGSPVAPGPDASWDAYLLLATIDVAASATSIVDADITDGRVYSQSNTAFGGFAPAGAILAYGGATAPTGWLLCQGQAVSRSTYAHLFSVLGTTFGVGDGSTTFNLPDLRQRFPLGKAASGTGSTLGATGGAIDHTHTGPSHTHTGPSHTHTISHTHQVDPPSTATSSDGSHSHAVASGFAGSSTNNVNVSPGSGLSVATSVHTHGEGTLATDTEAAHSHTVNIASVTSGAASTSTSGASGTGNTGASGTDVTGTANPPYLVVNYIIKT